MRMRGFGIRSYLCICICLGLVPACLFETDNTRQSSGPARFQYVGEAGFTPPGGFSVALQVSPAGTAYAAFTDASESGRVAVMRFSPLSGRWEKLGAGGTSVGAVYMLDLAMDPAGIPYLAFKDEGDSTRVTVLRWQPDSLRWARVGRENTTPGEISEFAFAIGPAGELYLAYKDREHEDRSTLLRYDKAGNAWHAVGDSGFTDSEGNFLTLAVDRAGTPYLGYYDEMRLGLASVMRYADGDWTPVGELGFSPAKANQTVLAIDSSGMPYLGYVDGFENTFKATVRRFASGAWTPLGEERFSSGQPLSLNLAISPKGTPYVAFSNYVPGIPPALNMLRWDDSAKTWQDVGGSSLTSASGRAVALAFGPDGEPWIAFLDNEDGRLSVMRLSE